MLKNKASRIALLTAFVTVGATPVFAADPILKIENFVGTVNIISEDRTDIKIVSKDNIQDVNFDKNGYGLTIDGGISDLDGQYCKGYYGRFSFSLFSDKKKKEGNFGGYEDLEDYPVLKIKVPNDVALHINNAIPFLTAGDIGSADLDFSHCGKVALGNIAGPLEAYIGGSADLTAGNVGEADIQIRGSGDVELDDVASVLLKVSGSGDASFENSGPADVTVSGSGDVEFEDITGTLDVSISGSGDFEVDEVRGDLTYNGSGSGNFSADNVEGNLDISQSGSGEVDIDDGNADHIHIVTGGSSDVNYDGTAQTAELRARGSSDIYVNEVSGDVQKQTSGSADISVNN